MKLTPEMLAAGKGEKGKIGKEWSLWYYDYHGLHKEVTKVVDELAEEWGWVCYTDEEAAPSFALDVLETCIVKGLVEVPSPPGPPPPTREEIHNDIMTRHCGPDWKEQLEKFGKEKDAQDAQSDD